MTAFRLNNLSASHQTADRDVVHALRNINLTVWPGEQLAIIGPSGAGKTTLLHTLACIHRPDTGDFSVFGVAPWGLPNEQRNALRTKLFLAPKTPSTPTKKTVATVLQTALSSQKSVWQTLKSLAKPGDTHAAYEALKRFKLQDKLDARVDDLSDSERQCCDMARLLMSAAETFLVDEPLSALEPILAAQALTLLQKEAKSRLATFICCLQQAELARSHFPRIVGLRDGQIVFDAKRAEVSDDMVAGLY